MRNSIHSIKHHHSQFHLLNWYFEVRVTRQHSRRGAYIPFHSISTVLSPLVAEFFEKFFDKKVTMGLVEAGFYEYEKDYVFATVETLNRDTHLFQYQPDTFDCIILDEYAIIGLSQEAA